MAKPTGSALRKRAEKAAIQALIALATSATSEQCRLLAARALLGHSGEPASVGGERLGKKEAAKRAAQTPDDSTPMGALLARRAKQAKGS